MLKQQSAKTMTGLSVHSDGIAVAGIQYSPQSIRLVFCAFVDNSVGGAWQKQVEMVARAHQLQKTQLQVVLQKENYSLLQVEAPQVPDAEMKDAVRWQVREMLETPLEDTVTSHVQVPDHMRGGRSPFLYVAAAQRSVLDDLAHPFHTAHLKIGSFDIPEMSLRNLVTLLPEDTQGVACLYLLPRRSLLIICHRGELCLARDFNMGWDDLIQDIHQPVDTPQVSSSVDQMTLEIQRSLDYYNSSFSMPPVGNLVVMPPQKMVPGLCSLLEEGLGVNTRIFDLVDIMQIPEEYVDAWIPCLLALGGALREVSL